MKRILKKIAYRYLDTVDIFVPASLIIILLHFFTGWTSSTVSEMPAGSFLFSQQGIF
jgi:hypothetical protein